jgi:hypothetical protein
LALFDLAIDSKLRACDLVKLRVRDVSHGDRIAARAIIMQQKTQRPVQFEMTEQTRDAVSAWIRRASLRSDDFLFRSRMHRSPHLPTRQYARIVDLWVREIGLDPAAYGTHTLRRTKASLIYRRTKNLRAVQVTARAYEVGEHGAFISASKLTTHSKWLNRRRCELQRRQRLPSLRSLTGQKRPHAISPQSGHSTLLPSEPSARALLRSYPANGRRLSESGPRPTCSPGGPSATNGRSGAKE